MKRFAVRLAVSICYHRGIVSKGRSAGKCAYCGAWFIGRRDRRFCSPRCRVIYYRDGVRVGSVVVSVRGGALVGGGGDGDGRRVGSPLEFVCKGCAALVECMSVGGRPPIFCGECRELRRARRRRE